MDRADLPATLAERPRDVSSGLPIPFLCGDEGADLRAVERRRATQCALSRICGMCGRSLEWQVAFLGSQAEADANGFHLPPMHLACAEAARAAYLPVGDGVLGTDPDTREWCLTVTGGFEFERPSGETEDRRPVFRPNSVVSEERSPA